MIARNRPCTAGCCATPEQVTRATQETLDAVVAGRVATLDEFLDELEARLIAEAARALDQLEARNG